MTSDALQILRLLFQTIWGLFNSWYFPGTVATPAAFMIFCMFAGLTLRFVRVFFSLPVDQPPASEGRPMADMRFRLNAPKRRR